MTEQTTTGLWVILQWFMTYGVGVNERWYEPGGVYTHRPPHDITDDGEFTCRPFVRDEPVALCTHCGQAFAAVAVNKDGQQVFSTPAAMRGNHQSFCMDRLTRIPGECDPLPETAQ